MSYLPLLGVGLFFVIVAVAVQLSSAGLVSRVSVAVGSRVAGRVRSAVSWWCCRGVLGRGVFS